jgi:superfamily II DNA or RNA helicase
VFDAVIPKMCEAIDTRAAWECCSYGTVPPRAEGWTGLIVDEVHGAAARDRAKVLAGIKAEYRIGLSATPLKRQDKRNSLVIGLLGPVVYTVEMGELVERGQLADGRVIRLVYRH